MQYVRQAIAYSAKTPREVVAATEETTARKLREMKYAIALEKELTKDEILERYLNIASFGNGAYGIYAASQVYFGKPPNELTLAGGGAAGLPGQGAQRLRPGHHTRANRSRSTAAATTSARTWSDLGSITQVRHDEAAKRARDRRTAPPHGCAEIQRPELGAGFFCDYFYRWWAEQKTFGANQYDRESRLE